MADDLVFIYPRSISQFKALMAEVRAHLYDSANKAALGDSYRVSVSEALIKFERVFLNRVKMVMDDSRKFHITKWATFLYCFICTWCRAFAHGKPDLLWKKFDSRWDAYFESFIRVSDGVMKLGIFDSLRLLCYYCPVSQCGAQGFCAEFCGSCHRGVQQMKTSSVTTASGKSKAQYQAAYDEWKKANPSKTHNKTEFLKAKPEFEKRSVSAPTKSGEMLSLTSAMAFLAINQEIIQEPLAEGHM
jgi:hypothetical protein